MKQASLNSAHKAIPMKSRNHPRSVVRRTPLLWTWGAAALLIHAGGFGIAHATDTALGPAHTRYGEGEFTINTPNHTEFTQTGSHAILDWSNDFQQPADHALVFRQDSDAWVLNRSPGLRPTEFFGHLGCEANCIFTNEAGVYFGDGSSVDVGRLIAAGGQISDANFTADRLLFTRLRGDIVNRGSMVGDAISLLGSSVSNFGSISTPEGSFMMLSGNSVYLRNMDSPILIRRALPRRARPGRGVGRPSPEPKLAIESSGTISAPGGHVRLAAGDMLSYTIRHSGTIEADQIEIKGAGNSAIEVSGVLDASRRDPARAGGQIDVLGEFISLVDGARLDASGSQGGGRIRVGGDLRGEGETATATGIFVSQGASISADATQRGNGGEIILFAEGTAQIYGPLSALGGPNGGNGGFVETSGKTWLDVSRPPRVGSRSQIPGDHAGQWLIDPNNIEIVGECDPATPPQCLNNGVITDSPLFENFRIVGPTVDNSQIGASIISTALEEGASVYIYTETIAETQGTQAGNITVSAAIRPKEANASPGTTGGLALLASNNLTLNAEIGVERQGATTEVESELKLELLFRAGDPNQAQSTAPSGGTPYAYSGKLEINSNLDSAGGSIFLQGRGVESREGTIVSTSGGRVDVSSQILSEDRTLLVGGGDVILQGDIVTRTDVPDDEGNQQIGGAIVIVSQAFQQPTSDSEGSPSEVVGERMVLAGDLETGGASVDLLAAGGNIYLEGDISTDLPNLETGSETKRGGAVLLSAVASLVAAESAADPEPVIVGGRVQVGEESDWKTGGGFVEIGVGSDPTLSAAQQIVMRGRIDTSMPTVTGETPQAGGNVTFVTSGDDALTLIKDFNPADDKKTFIKTGGASFQSRGSGDFFLEDASILTLENAPESETLTPLLNLEHSGTITISETVDDATRLQADFAFILPPFGVGEGNLNFLGSPIIEASHISLGVGDGAGGDRTSAQIALGDVVFQLLDSDASSSVILNQDADFPVDDISSHFYEQDFSRLDSLWLASADGTLSVTQENSFDAPDLDLLLIGGQGISLAPGFIEGEVDQLRLEVLREFTVSAELAQAISNAASELSITAGTPAEGETTSLKIEDALTATTSISLRAGKFGTGNLVFEGEPTLTAQNISLWAGDGDSSGSATIDPDSLSEVNFTNPNGGALESFSIRQDAAITDVHIPTSSRFTGGIAEMEYTLRSDGTPDSGVSITLGQASADRLADTHLSLQAQQGIDLSGFDEGGLLVRTLDIGGLGDFEYTSALDQKIAFASEPDSQLFIRAALNGTGVLTFEADLTVRADEIRLISGDGPVLDESIQTLASISLTPTTGNAPVFESLSGGDLDFVYRQDASISLDQLPNTETHFAGTPPSQFGIRSDNGAIALDFSKEEATSPSLSLQAKDQIIMSAPYVTLYRSDGENLDIDTILDISVEAADDPNRQIRTNVAYLSTSGSDATGVAAAAIVEPGSDLRLTDFDDDDSFEGFRPVPMSLDTLPDTAPNEIEISQDGNIIAEEMIDPATQLGAGTDTATLNFYALNSRMGSVTVTPEKVRDADLLLQLIALDLEPSSDRSIHFDGYSEENPFILSSINALSPYEWKIEGGQTSEEVLSIQATEYIRFRAGLLNQGNLEFSGEVSLDSNNIILTAGVSPLSEVYPNTPEPTLGSRPIVKTHNEDGRNLSFTLRTSEDDPTTSFFIQQGGDLGDTMATGVTDASLLPLATQFTYIDTPDTPSTHVMEFDAIYGQLEIFDFAGASNPLLASDKVTLRSGYGIQTEESIGKSWIKIGQSDGSDLDLRNFELFLMYANEIEFATGGTGLLKLRSEDSLFLLGPSLYQSGLPTYLSPSAVTFEQEASFVETDSTCLLSACLPFPEIQFGPEHAQEMDYTIRSTAGSVTINDTTALNVSGSNLILEAGAGGGDPQSPDITIEIASTRPNDLNLSSLQVGSATDETPLEINLVDADAGGEHDLGILTTAQQTYYGNLRIDGEVSLSSASQGVTVTGTVDAEAGANESYADELILTVAANSRLEGNVGQDITNPLELLRLNFLPESSDIPSLQFGGDSGDSSVRVDTAEFLYTDQIDGSDRQPRSSPVATIFTRNGNLTFDVTNFTMGEGEKLSVQGDLSINALETAILGDLSALDQITVSAPKISMQLRPGGTFLTSTGDSLPDGGVDYAANHIDFQGTLEQIGSGRRPLFGIEDPQSAPAWMLDYLVFQTVAGGSPVSPADFELSGLAQIADLHPLGGGRDDPSTMFFNPKRVPIPPPWDPSNWIPFHQDSVMELDIAVRLMTNREYRSRLRGATVIDDVGTELTAWDGRALEVSEARINGEEAEHAVAILKQLFGPRESRATWVRDVLQNALDQYRRTTGARRVVGFELRRYVKNRPSSLYQAHKVLEDLDKLFAMHRGLGLTPGEYRPIQKRWLALIKPEGITTSELAETIQPSRYVRGSDVLDIFGD